MYAAISTKPDIAYATSYLGRFASKASETHWRALKKVMGYLANTCFTLGRTT
jgi:hypothetical protein